MGFDVVSLSAGIDESRLADETLSEHVARLALAKANHGVSRSQITEMPVIGGDTIVVSNGQLFGKPKDRDDGIRMLRALSGTTHSVLTSAAVLWRGTSQVRVVDSTVTFASLTDTDIADYWATGEPTGKAGAYAIQGLGGRFVKHLSGSYTAVMGLPVHEVWHMLSSLKDWQPHQGERNA